MKRGIVYCCGEKAGELVRDDEGYLFRYDPLYFADSTKPGVAATVSMLTSVMTIGRTFSPRGNLPTVLSNASGWPRSSRNRKLTPLSCGVFFSM